MKKQGIIKISIGVVIGLLMAFLLRPISEPIEIAMTQRQFTISFTCIVLGALCGVLVHYLLDEKIRKKSEVSKEQKSVDIGKSKGVTILLMAIGGLIIGFVMRPEIPIIGQKVPFASVISRGVISEGVEMGTYGQMAKEAFNVMILWGIIGGIVGFFLTFKLKFDYIKYIGKNIRTGISVCLNYIIFKQKIVVIMILLALSIRVTVSPEGSTIILYGILGGLVGGLASFGVSKVNKRTLSEKRMRRLIKKRTRFSMLDYVNYRVLWLTIEHSIIHQEIGDIMGLLGIMFISSILPSAIILWILGVSFIQAIGIWLVVTFIYYSVVDCVKKVYIVV